MHIIFIKIIMCNSRRQPIYVIPNKSKLLRYSVVWRIQKDNMTIMYRRNSNNFILKIWNSLQESASLPSGITDGKEYIPDGKENTIDGKESHGW